VRLEEVKGQLLPLFPGVKKEWETVKRQLDMLRSHREEIQSADQDELRRVREEISIVNEGIETRRAEIATHQSEAEKLAAEEVELRKMIEECRGKIEKAELVKELNRGFEKTEVEGFKGMFSFGGVLTVDNLRWLREVSGWDILKVDGTNVRMSLRTDIIVSFDTTELARGGSATVELPSVIDPVQQFTFSALNQSALKGDVRSVSTPLIITNNRSSRKFPEFITYQHYCAPN